MQARAVKVPTEVGAVADNVPGAAAVATDGGRARKKEVFWMRDPNTGCWIPENRFDEVDAVELRNQLLHHN